jgi:hypothetical protein
VRCEVLLFAGLAEAVGARRLVGPVDVRAAPLPLDLLALWGICDPPNCPSDACSAADLDCSGSVGMPDLLELLACWGPCGTCTPEGAPQNIQDCFDRYGYEDPLVLQHCICAVEPCTEGCPPGGCQ